MEINVRLQDVEKSVALCNQLVDQYPDSQWSPRAWLLLGSYVYEDQLNDTALAHAAYQRIIDDYPNDDLVNDARVLIKCLGLSDDEKLAMILMSQMPVEESEE